MRIEAYQEQFGEFTFPEGFLESLQGLSIEEQMNRYRTTGYSKFVSTGYGSRTMEYGYRKLEEDSDVKALIVKDDILIGVIMSDAWNCEVPCFAEKKICTYYASDNNGAGYKERINYAWLLCVPEDFEKLLI